jgi:hypothetical protein
MTDAIPFLYWRFSYEIIDRNDTNYFSRCRTHGEATAQKESSADIRILRPRLSGIADVSIDRIAFVSTEYVQFIKAPCNFLLCRNPNAKSIEQELFGAICRAGGVSKANSESLKKIGWARAARTDKGVHAVGQIVALKISVTTADMR